MPIIYKTNVAVFDGVCGIEEGDDLLQWFSEHPKGKINLKQSTHIHTALIQIIMCQQPTVSVTPEDPEFEIFWRESIATVMSAETETT
ncbi:hypothetical protein [Marinomonas communis]|uniref:hypothetical protein n=1 Tax=Marinomonas communis TaxID=28254 RepID=UPI0010009B53|nr:hypothetical protein [Marinomonas communis]MCC4275762.1 hypothetical protein [Marinomonas communis]RUM53968.1 MAG: hypothetical protein DSY85_07885 [Marinomonas sp.]